MAEQTTGRTTSTPQRDGIDARLHVGLVQAASGLDPVSNRELVVALVEQAADEAWEQSPDDQVLVVLPEVIARDFGKPGTDLSAFAEPLDGPFVTALAKVARAKAVHVLAGMFREDEDGDPRPANTLVLVGPEGLLASYDKIHLYDSFGYKESDGLRAGEWNPVVVEVGGFNLGLMTCYDLRFPELARALVDAEAEVLVLPAAWVAGERKVDHWRVLTQARAVENTVYVVAVGQPAPRYSGHSAVVDPTGEVLIEAGSGSSDEPVILHQVLDGKVVRSARAVNPSLANRRG